MRINDLLTLSDGSGRKLRQVQTDVLSWVADKWSGDRHLALSIPTGVGKSLISRSIQNLTNGAIVTPTNGLVKQYTEAYKDLPYVIGQAHYKCKSEDGLSCVYKTEVLKQKCCETCDYVVGRKAALSGLPCIYNPMSLLNIKKHPDFISPSVTIIDEAHAVLSMLQTIGSQKIKIDLKTLHKQYGISSPAKLLNIFFLLDFLKKKVVALQDDFAKFEHSWTLRTKASRSKKIYSLETTIEGLETEPQNYSIFWEKDSIVIKCVLLPKSIIRSVFGNTRFVLLSATLFKPDLKDFFQDNAYDYADFKSPIPVANRPIYYKPMQFPLNHTTDPQLIADEIEKVIKQYPNVNTLIHMPYSLAKVVVPKMTSQVYTHTADDKDRKLELWKQSGGIFVGSGLYEGIDLPGDLCRLNIVVKIPFPNMNDVSVQKRKALEDGNLWFAAESLKAVIQSVGRSTRSETDASHIYILDPNFGRLHNQNRNWLPTAFTSAIVWSRQHEKLRDIPEAV